MIAFEVLLHADLPLAVAALVDTAGQVGQTLDFELGPFDDDALLSDRRVFVTGPDEVEAADVLVVNLNERGVRWRGL